MTHKLYRDDAYLLEFEAEVVARFEHAGRPVVQLDRTAFYAESGGQPCDLGHVAGVRVLDVQEHGDDVWHVLEQALPAHANSVIGLIDGARRRDHMQQHHGQHLLSRALLEQGALRTVGFHLGAEETTIDLDGALAPECLRAAVERANARVWEALPVEVREVEPGEAARLGCVSPAGVTGRVRLVAAGAFDVQPCGGTHPRCTSEVGVILVLGSERHKGGSRVRFVCGQRALDATARRFDVLNVLSTRFSAPWHDLATATQHNLEALGELRRQLDECKTRVLDEEARGLLAALAKDAGTEGVEPVLMQTMSARSSADLRNLALALVARAACVALLAAPDGRGGSSLVFARRSGSAADIAGAMRDALALLGGRGGGRGDVVQGGAPRADGLEDALATAATRVRGARS